MRLSDSRQQEEVRESVKAPHIDRYSIRKISGARPFVLLWDHELDRSCVVGRNTFCKLVKMGTINESDFPNGTSR